MIFPLKENSPIFILAHGTISANAAAGKDEKNTAAPGKIISRSEFEPGNTHISEREVFMRKSMLITALILLTFLVTVPLLAAEMVDSPMYIHWARFKLGSFAQYTIKSKLPTMTTESEQTQTLKTVTAQKATVQITMVMTVAGNKTQVPPSSMELPAKIEKAKLGEYKLEYNPKAKILGKGKEKFTIKGKYVQADWIKAEVEQNGMKTVETIWTSDDIPGTVVKTLQVTGAPANTTVEMMLVDFKADKK